MNAQLRHKQRLLRRVRRAVIKIGSSILSGPQGIDRQRLRALAEEICRLHDQGINIVVVSSGAVAAGMARLGMKERPKTVPQRQAAAAVGQIDLMALYEEYFATFSKQVAQILLTHDDLANRSRYLNARHTIETLIAAGVIPVANENDTVAIEELNFGDNDNLSALIAGLVEADVLVLLSDVAGLYTKDPRANADAELVSVVEDAGRAAAAYVMDGKGPLGTGGMASKFAAAKKAAAAGIPTIITDGLRPSTLPAVFDVRQAVGTLVLPQGDRLGRRKHWIAYTLKPAGCVVVDQGAYEAITQRGRSLLPKGLTAVEGKFGPGDCVRCVDPSGREFARGLVNYSAAELERIKGVHSAGIEGILGYTLAEEVIHRNDLVLTGTSGS